MRMRTFLAPTMADAMAQLRHALGDEAIIVSSFETPDGMMEIVGAVEGPPSAGFEAPASPAWQGLSDLEHQLETMLRERLRNSAKPAPAHTPDLLKSGIAFNREAMAEALDSHALPVRLRDELLASAASLHHDDAVTALAAALEMRFGFEPMPALPATPLMLMGLPGSGKTVTLAKLAARAIMEHGNCDILCADTQRTGAMSQSEAYADLVGASVTAIDLPEHLASTLANRQTAGNAQHSVCLIDTASINPFDDHDYSSLEILIEAARRSERIEPVLVLAATGDSLLLCDVARRFAELGARRLIATQLDIARRLGPILAAADAGGLSLAQISVTPYLARGLAQITPPICAELLLAPLAESKKTTHSMPRKTGTVS